jgi:hypothetical protein
MRLGSIFLTTLMVLACGVSIAKQSDQDWQHWNAFVVKYNATERLTLSFDTEQVTLDDLDDFTFYDVTFGASYTLTDWFALGAEYTHADAKKGSDWTSENRYVIAPTIKGTISDLKWALRTKVEYRDFENSTDWRIRERLKISIPAKILDFEFTPFISDEIFYSSKLDRLYQHRIKIGGAKKLSDHWNLNLYYMNIATDIPDHNDWAYSNIIGTELIFKF